MRSCCSAVSDHRDDRHPDGDLEGDDLRRAALAATGSGLGAVAGTAIRCRESLRLAAECLGRAQGLVQQRSGDELGATEVRVALEELGKVVGAVYTDDLLDRVFSRFCIGK